jgi:hypothetical protein
MSRIHPPAPSSPPPLSTVGCQTCEACGGHMRLVIVEPYILYENIDLHGYVCDCGKSKELFICRGIDADLVARVQY